MKAIILAAGKATRLLPLTKDTPQCLLKIRDKTILEHQLGILNKAGIKGISVICGYMADKVEALCNKLRVKFLFNPFYEVSGTALTLWVAREELKDGFIFLYSDILFDPKVIKGLLGNKGDICLAIKKSGLREEAEKIIEENGVIKSVTKIEMEGENGEFIGIAKFSESGTKKLVEELYEAAKTNINTRFIQIIDNLIKKGEPVTAYDIKGTNFIDIDFPDDLERAKEFLE